MSDAHNGVLEPGTDAIDPGTQGVSQQQLPPQDDAERYMRHQAGHDDEPAGDDAADASQSDSFPPHGDDNPDDDPPAGRPEQQTGDGEFHSLGDRSPNRQGPGRQQFYEQMSEQQQQQQRDLVRQQQTHSMLQQ